MIYDEVVLDTRCVPSTGNIVVSFPSKSVPCNWNGAPKCCRFMSPTHLRGAVSLLMRQNGCRSMSPTHSRASHSSLGRVTSSLTRQVILRSMAVSPLISSNCGDGAADLCHPLTLCVIAFSLHEERHHKMPCRYVLSCEDGNYAMISFPQMGCLCLRLLATV